MTRIKQSNSLAINYSIEQLPGLSKEQQILLKDCGIQTTQQLLKLTSTEQLKQQLANKLQIKIQYLNKWIAMADLASLPSVGDQYCGLLLHAGIASVSQLALTSVGRLHQQILRLQVATMQRRDLCPTVEKVQQWIQQAQVFSRQSK